jgi:hypothetical protein
MEFVILWQCGGEEWKRNYCIDLCVVRESGIVEREGERGEREGGQSRRAVGCGQDQAKWRRTG